MSALNWGMIQDGGAFESLMHAILYAEDAGIILFGRPGKDAGQDARSADGSVIYQAKYRQGMTMDGAVRVAKEELKKIKEYRQPLHQNYEHWQNARKWVLVATFSINPKDVTKWKTEVVPAFQQEGLTVEYWDIETLEGKLMEHGHIRDVFFSGENRVLVGLKEAHDLLSSGCIGSASLDKPMVGREAEIKAVIDFADAAETRIMPVVGPGGIGKSRFLYECLMSLSMKGWRVFWALPESMARSSHWFRLLNGNQRTCVAIDNPEDPGILRVVIEQLAPVERRNWKVIVACRSEKAEMLRRLQNNRQVEKTLQLTPLSENTSKELLQSLTADHKEEAWLYNIYSYMRGVPGWLCLIAELSNRGSLSELPRHADDVASIYVNSSLQSLEPAQRDMGRTLLRWLSLWGVLKLNIGGEPQEEFHFLNILEVPDSIVHDLLRKLVATGLVHNWGVNKRLYAVEPLIIRENILSEWLLEEDGGKYRVSGEGKQLVERLLKEDVPAADKIIGTLSHLSRFRLDTQVGFSFLKPIFDSMTALAMEGTVLDQYMVVDLIERAGTADPESALDVLIAIRQNPKEKKEVKVPLWGAQTFTHAFLISKLPWVMFQIAEHVSSYSVARRFLTAFRALSDLDEAIFERPASGKSTRELLERLLCRSKSWGIYAQPARDIVEAELENPAFGPFVTLLLRSLLNPEREFTEWTANWRLSFARRAFAPGSAEWTLAAEIRAKVFRVLQTSTNLDIRSRLWKVMAESHRQFHRMVLHGHVTGTAGPLYRTVLIDDLTACASILRSSPISLTIEEATSARDMWAWYLQYGRDNDPLDLARQCEQLYNGLSTWRLHDFFQFKTETELVPETERVASILRSAPDIEVFVNFFVETERYLKAARQGAKDSADWARVSVLADALADQFNPSEATPTVLTSYATQVLEQADDGKNELARHFVIRICQQYLRSTKETKDQAAISNELRRLLALTQTKDSFLFDLYSNAHPQIVGALTSIELDCILEQEQELPLHRRFILFGTFALVNWEIVQDRLRSCITTETRKEEISPHVARFIQSLYLSAIRYNWPPDQVPMDWIINLIRDLGLDGALFEMHELTHLRDNSGFKLSITQLTALIRSRMELERMPIENSSFRIMPHDFSIQKWCEFDATNQNEIYAFQDFCSLALEPGFIALHWMPKYVAQLDPSGVHVGKFVEQYLKRPVINTEALERLAYLASAYLDTSEAWAIIARPICQKAQDLRQEEREQIYFGLTRNETEVFTSIPGEVPDYYFRACDDAARMLDAEPMTSPLREYREWALRRSERYLKQEQGRAEENANG